MNSRFCHHSSRLRWLCLLVVVAALNRGVKLFANPQGMTVVSGTAGAHTSGSQLNVVTGQFTVLNWNSFNIQSGETTSFLQPSGNAVVFNNIGDVNPSQIWGNLNANGTVILANANGLYFGPNSMVKVGGNFIATTAPLPPDFGAGSAWQFTGLPPLAKIVNYGQIQAGAGHSLYFIAEKIENNGTLAASGGDIQLAAGQSVLVSDRPDGRGLSATVNLPAGSVDNHGNIVADAGTIALHAQIVNQDGILQADSVHSQNGEIDLVAGDAVNLGANSQILARGDGTGLGSPGGKVVVQSGDDFSDVAGGKISVAGGSQGGSGGSVEVSAPNVLSLNSTLDAAARAGWSDGVFNLDPVNIILGNSTTGGAIDVNTAFTGFSSISLQASGNISLNAGTTWDLSNSTGNNAGQLNLSAGGNITFLGAGSQKSQIIDANDWSVNLSAGVSSGSGRVQPGVGSILINSGDIQLAQGSINLTAGQDITVGTGFVNTVGGGGIVADALAGSVNAGANNAGYIFGATSIGFENSGYGYFIGTFVNNEPQVGGISTIGGGSVTLEAGQDVISTPAATQGFAGGSGAYGQEHGDVTIVAGSQILGNYLVRNGTGTLEAGVNVQNGQVTVLNPAANIGVPATPAGSSTSPVTLSLMSGDWLAYAANDIYISEVRNPNGVFNRNQIAVPWNTYAGNIDSTGTITPAPARQAFLFDYAPDAAASFWAGDAIILGNYNSPSTGISYYPPGLSLNAGTGGITIENSIVLYPSSQGSLNLNDQGNLQGVFIPYSTGGTGGVVTGIAMSDSGLPDRATFAGGHSVTPLHRNDANPVILNVAGNIDTFSLSVPTFAEMTVGGNVLNFGFSGQNISALQTSYLKVGGDITFQGAVSTVTFSDSLPASLFDQTASTDPGVTANFFYDATKGTLSYGGIMTAQDEAFLLNPTIYAPDASGNLVATPVTFSSTQVQSDYLAAVAGLYSKSQSASFVDSQGINLNGPGRFNTSAQNMDLGNSGGINVNRLPSPSLTALDPDGANLDISLAGNLEMTTSKISNSGLLGGIQIGSAAQPLGGTVDLGLQSGIFGAATTARGIFTSGGGNVAVTSEGDVNVDGSRIATLAGGNVNVTSLQGDVNAGAGGNGSVTVDTVVQLAADGSLETFDSKTHADNTVYGSGIMALALGESTLAVGNITVAAPHGSINADVGGIQQVAYNNNVPAAAFIDLSAGQNINAGSSGVIGASIKAQAGGNVAGIFVGSGGIDINAGNNFSGTVVGSSAVSLNAGGSVTGSIIGGGDVSVSGLAISADIIGSSVAAAGNTSGATEGFSTASLSQPGGRVVDEPSAASTGNGNEDDEKKKKGKPIALAQRTSRVTVVLPSSPTP